MEDFLEVEAEEGRVTAQLWGLGLAYRVSMESLVVFLAQVALGWVHRVGSLWLGLF